MKEAQPALESRTSASSSSAKATRLTPPAYGIATVDAALADAPVQRSARGLAIDDPDHIRAAALQGITGAGEALPHRDRIAASFGRFDVSQIVAHTDSAAQAGARSMGANGFAMGNHVAFATPPSLHTAAHEAAHVVQQRAGVHLDGGVGRVGDPYERNADEVADEVVQGRSAEALLGRFAGPGAGGPPQVQRNVAIDIAGKAAGNFAWSYMQELITAHKVPSTLATLIKEAVLMLVDYGVRVTGLADYLAVMNPYVEVLRRIKAAVESIPEPIRVLLTYGIGYGIHRFSTSWMGGAITESHISGLLIEGGTFVSVLGSVIEFLYDVGHNPASTIYKAVWAAISVVGAAKARWWDQTSVGDADKPSDAPKPAPDKPMLDANLGWFWLNAATPKLARWKETTDKYGGKTDKPIDRGGLVLDSRFGFKVFGHVVGTDSLEVKVPYNASEWSATFNKIPVLSSPVTLGTIFKGGPIDINRIRIGQDGLQFLHLTIGAFDFGDGVFKAEELSMSYRRGEDNSLLHFRGAAKLDALGTKVNGKFDLEIDTKGNFHGGGVALEAPKTFTLLQDRLVLANPKLWASWKGGKTDIGIGGDLQVKLLGSLEFASTGTKIQYTTDKGFFGTVDKAGLAVPVHKGGVLRFEMLNGEISKAGFKAGKVSVIYAYGEKDIAKNPDPSKPSKTSLPEPGKLKDSDITSLGFDLGWLGTTGLETLVVDLSAADVMIGSKGLDVGALSREVTKFKAKVFGLGAEFDSKAGTGAISGDFNRTLNITALSLRFPLLIPGVNAAFDLGASLAFDANFKATLERLRAETPAPPKHIHPWQLGGKVGLAAGAEIKISAGVSVGIPYLAEVTGSIFASAKTGIQIDADAKGKVLWNENTHALSLPDRVEDKPSAELTGKAMMSASVGAEIRGRLLYVFDKQLWSYKFVEWKLGEWAVSAKVVANAKGDYDIITTKAGFAGEGGRPNTQPIVEKERVTAMEIIDDVTKRAKKIDDPHLMWRIVHELKDPRAPVDMGGKPYFTLLKAINGTSLDLDAVADQVFRYVAMRSSGGMSLLMSPREWEAFSTTAKLLSDDPTERSSIKPIDDAVAAYHAVRVDKTTLAERKAILTNLIEKLIPTYTGQLLVSRKDMASKLWTDAQRELARISA